MKIIIKPHHLLDIYKLHGTGINQFVPDLNYHHDFYLIGNYILNQQVKEIVFTIDKDDICHPCKYVKHGLCHDTFVKDNKTLIKDDFNKQIDNRLLQSLNLNINTTYNYQTIIKLLQQKLTFEMIDTIWSIHSKDDNQTRYNYIYKGINNLINQD